MNRYRVVVLGSLFAVINLFAAPAVVKSPDGQVTASFEVKDGALSFSVSKAGKPIIASSRIAIIAGAKMEEVERAIRSNDTSWKPVWGQFSTIRDHHNELRIMMTADGMPLDFICRVFDTGVGFRFSLSEQTKGQKLVFSNDWKLTEENGFYVTKGEQGVEGPISLEGLKRVPVPVVLEYADGSAIALLESDLFTASAFGAMHSVFNKTSKALESTSSTVSNGAGQVTPWRVVLIGDTLGQLSIDTVTLNLAAPCRLEDTSWIKPGKGLWDWRVHGYKAGDFVYGINTASCLRFIDFCSAQGIEYFTLDDHWFLSAKDGKIVVSPEVDIEKVMSYAKEKGVMIKLYYDRKKGNFGDETLFSHYAALGASGMKYGFMGSKTDFTRSAISAAADHKMVINFHDGPVPMTGVERTMPNLITREYCHAQQDSRRAFTPETFLKMAMVNALIGPLDMANGNFGIRSINAGERQKGPKKKNTYISTVVSEVARCVVIYTGLVTLPDAPEEYLKKPDLFEFLKVMPATWDDSKVLHAQISECISVARRSGDTWFVASVNNQSERTLNITLDFLKAGIVYEASVCQDASDSHGVKNPEAYEIKTIKVKKGDVVPASMAVGGGHAMILRPVK